MLTHSNISYKATSDITVFKIFKTLGYNKWFAESEGMLMHPNQTFSMHNDSLLWNDFNGFESYESETHAQKRAKYLTDTTKNRYVVIECTIPHNTSYFIGSRADIGDIIVFSSDVLKIRTHESWIDNLLDLFKS